MNIFPLAAPTTVNAAGNSTLTGAALASENIFRTGATANFTDTTDTAVNILASLPGGLTYSGATPNLPAPFYVDIANQTGFVQTIAGGTGVTLAGPSATLGYGCVGTFLVQFTSITAPARGPDDRLGSVVTAAACTMTLVKITNSTLGGSSSAFIAEEGNIFRQVSNAAGVQPASTAADVVVAVYSLPANFFDGIGNRGICITAQGTVVNNANTKRAKIIFNPSAAVVGSAVTGGTTVADTGSVTTVGGGWSLMANVFKTGAANSNTQTAIHQAAQTGGTLQSLLAPSNVTATENAAILIAVTINCATAATDMVLNFAEVNAMN